MARKTVSTGIYEHVEFGTIDDAAILEIARALNGELAMGKITMADFVGVLKKIKSQAKAILAEGYGEIITNEAKGAIACCDQTAIAILQKEGGGALMRAFLLGRRTERLQVRFHEPDAKRGKTVISNLSANGMKRAEKYGPRNARMKRMVGEYLRKNPERTKSDAYRSVGRELKIKPEAVRKAITRRK